MGGRAFLGTWQKPAFLSGAKIDVYKRQVGICTSKVNKRSQRIIEKCGFTYEGTIRRFYKIYDGTLRDSMVFSMLKEEYESMYR